MLRVIHLSDFHLESESPSLLKKSIVKSLCKDLKAYVNDHVLLVFTGDLVDKGGLEFHDKDNVFQAFEREFVTPLIETYPTLRGKLFVVPGNHDVVRAKIDKWTEAGLKESLVNQKELEAFIDENHQGSPHLSRIEDYQKWARDFYNRHNPEGVISSFENCFVFDLGPYKIGVACLNSAWLCKDDNDKGQLLLGKKQLENALEHFETCDIKIALAHHPLEFLTQFDQEAIKPLIYKNFNVFMTGHVHELSSSYTQDLLGDIFISIANSTIADFPKKRRYVNGYTIIDLYPQDKIVATYRKYIEDQDVFVPNTDIGTEDGTGEFKLLKDKSLELFEESQRIVEGIANRYCDKLNNHIIMSSASTDADCSIENLFVEPRILNSPRDTFKDEDVVKYSVESIINSTENFLIYGAKESGKTLLLDKMFLELTKRFNQLNKIPVLIRFSDLKTKSVIEIVKDFVSKPKKQIPSFIVENQVCLLIDNISFSENYKSQVAALCELRIQFPNVQIIASSEQVLENVMPTDYLAYNDQLEFSIGFIQDFNTNEIKQYVTKWFAGKEVDLEESMQRLIKSFVDFGLPKTPLSITLFLWIFEKQEKKPINNSVLVELFVENLLEKTNLENIYSETFDFSNKKRLLSFVAKYMRDEGNGDLSYAVDYVDLLGFFRDYLKSRFTGQPQKVLDDFINRGILAFEGENLVRFKSAFYFHYFLAVHFDIDEKFKLEVFEPDNYLNYTDEIVYYTGLKRDDVKVLEFTQTRLDEAFGDFNKEIIENHEKFDKVLDARNDEALSAQIQEPSLDSKMTEEELDQAYDQSLSSIPVQKSIAKKDIEPADNRKHLDRILKLASSVLKNSEDVDDFDVKKKAYSNTLIGSMSFLIQYREALLMYYLEHKKQPDHFPKNMNFKMYIRMLPLIHQVVLFNWLGSQKLLPVIVDKMEKDKKESVISEYEKFLSVFLYGDIKGLNYPEVVEKFIKGADKNYIKDLSFLKLMSYFHLRKNTKDLDKKYLDLMSEIKVDLGQMSKKDKGKFIQNQEKGKRVG